MQQRKILLLFAAIAIVTGFGAMSFTKSDKSEIIDFGDDSPLWEVLEKLGHSGAPKAVLSGNASAEKGRELVHKGYTTDANGKKTAKQSKFFVCTTCHNVQKEFDDPSKISPDERLAYAAKNGIPYLQASTFYGIVNRSSFFNGDYQKIYEKTDGIKEANTDLKAAIAFCAINNGQGRKLESWEIESILAYFWTLQFKMSDLKLLQAEKDQLEKAIATGNGKTSAVDMLKTKYSQAMPATVLHIPAFKSPDEALYNDTKRLKEGKIIYQQACLHCHLNKKYSFFALDNDLLTFKAMEKAARTENYIFSMYFLVREGLPPRMGHRSHMPLFTAEKMSPEQLESLYLYVSAKAKKKYKE